VTDEVRRRECQDGATKERRHEWIASSRKVRRRESDAVTVLRPFSHHVPRVSSVVHPTLDAQDADRAPRVLRAGHGVIASSG
jgi:hypothetical protein